MARPSKRARLPREHGFWVMFAAVMLSALLRATWAPLVVVTWLVTALGAIAAASLLGPYIRRRGNAQLGSAAALGFLGLPVDLLHGAPLLDALSTSLCWSAIFVSSAAVVRAAFSRARDSKTRSLSLTALSVGIPWLLFCLFLGVGRTREAIACVVAALGTSAIAHWSPSLKQLKPVGLSLGAIASVAAIVLSI